MRKVLAALVLSSAVVVSAQTPLVVRDIDGVPRSPLAPATGQVNVLFFIDVECPISNRYAPEIARIARDYAPRHVHPFLVYADPALDIARVRAHMKDFYPGTTVPAIIDTTFAITAAVGATVTPQAVVYTPAGRVYRGRIDDWYVSLNQNRRSPTEHDLRVSLDAVLAGRPVPIAQTQAVGCYIQRYAK